MTLPKVYCIDCDRMLDPTSIDQIFSCYSCGNTICNNCAKLDGTNRYCSKCFEHITTIPKVKAKTKPKPRSKVKTKTGLKAKAKARPKTRSKVKTKAGLKAKSKTKPKPRSKVKTKAKTKRK